MLREGKAGELLAEILHHVVALELAMNEHVEANLFLPAHGARGFFAQEALVGGSVDDILPMVGTRLAHLRCLRERPDGRCRIGRQTELAALDLPPGLERRDSRRDSDGSVAAIRALTAGLLIFGEVRRDAITAEAASRAARTLSRPSFRARASTTSSATFCTAKASQLRTSGSRSVSRSRSIGVCSSEHDGATTISRPDATTGSMRSRMAFRSAAQMLRPSMTPNDKTRSGRAPASTASSCSGARTRSTCRPCTGNASAVDRLSARLPK